MSGRKHANNNFYFITFSSILFCIFHNFNTLKTHIVDFKVGKKHINKFLKLQNEL